MGPGRSQYYYWEEHQGPQLEGTTTTEQSPVEPSPIPCLARAPYGTKAAAPQPPPAHLEEENVAVVVVVVVVVVAVSEHEPDGGAPSNCLTWQLIPNISQLGLSYLFLRRNVRDDFSNR